MKEYNVKRNYVTKHANMYESSNKKSEKNKLTILKKSIKAQQSVFIRASRDRLSNVKLSFKLVKQLEKITDTLAIANLSKITWECL